MAATLVIASNRGPVSFSRTTDGFASTRGMGGLVTAVTASLEKESATWIATAMSQDDRARVLTGEPIRDEPSEGINLKLLIFADEVLTGFYEQASNQSIWFVAHGTAATIAEVSAWNAYRLVNTRFAEAIAEAAAPNATVLVQDYHLCLVPSLLRQMRPDLKISFFWHIGFPEPEDWARLGEGLARDLLEGINAAHMAGFHAARWTQRFSQALDRFGLESRARLETIPLGIDVSSLAALAASDAVEMRLTALDEFADQILVVRSDRIDPAKGVPDGLRALERLLDRRIDLRGNVTHLVRLTPSREGIHEYDLERDQIHALTDQINARFAKGSWKPVVLKIEDDLPSSIAAYRRYDVLMVTSLADGMNLVAREGPLVNERDGVLILSTGAGAAYEYASAGALLVEPRDVDAISAALETAIDMSAAERRRISSEARAIAPGMPPADWLSLQRNLVSEI